MAAIYVIFEPNILGFQISFSGLTAEPTNWSPVRDYDPNTPLESTLLKVKIREKEEERVGTKQERIK